MRQHTPLEITPDLNPFSLFQEWLGDAELGEPNDASAMCLSTVNADNKPTSRMVLLKGVYARGFVFYTNDSSRKSLHIKNNQNVALCFHWKSLRRQVRIEGQAVEVTAAEADAYFSSRPRNSQIGAWVSAQSAILPSRTAFENAFEEMRLKYESSEDIPRPPYWRGYRVTPDLLEFWLDMPFRLHDRTQFTLRDDGQWHVVKLYP
jgi:pyridoxamine 5'-phosphate oxidase